MTLKRFIQTNTKECIIVPINDNDRCPVNDNDRCPVNDNDRCPINDNDRCSCKF